MWSLTKGKTEKVYPAPFRNKTAANKLLETVPSARLKKTHKDDNGNNLFVTVNQKETEMQSSNWLS